MWKRWLLLYFTSLRNFPIYLETKPPGLPLVITSMSLSLFASNVRLPSYHYHGIHHHLITKSSFIFPHDSQHNSSVLRFQLQIISQAGIPLVNRGPEVNSAIISNDNIEDGLPIFAFIVRQWVFNHSAPPRPDIL